MWLWVCGPVASGRKKCKVMFNSDDLCDIGLGLPLLAEHQEKAPALLWMEKMVWT